MLAVERLMPVPGVLRAAESEERAAMRRDFLGVIVEVAAVLQDAEPAAVSAGGSTVD